MAKAATKQKHEQDAIDGLEACQINFVGMAIDEIAQPPGLDQLMTFKVTAICCGEPFKERLKTGSTRIKAKMRVEKIEVLSGPTTPEAGPDLFSDDEDDDE